MHKKYTHNKLPYENVFEEIKHAIMSGDVIRIENTFDKHKKKINKKCLNAFIEMYCKKKIGINLTNDLDILISLIYKYGADIRGNLKDHSVFFNTIEGYGYYEPDLNVLLGKLSPIYNEINNYVRNKRENSGMSRIKGTSNNQWIVTQIGGKSINLSVYSSGVATRYSMYKDFINFEEMKKFLIDNDVDVMNPTESEIVLFKLVCLK